MAEIVEDRFIERFVAHSAIERFADPVLHRLARRDEIPGEPALLRPASNHQPFQIGFARQRGEDRRCVALDSTIGRRISRRPEVARKRGRMPRALVAPAAA